MLKEITNLNETSDDLRRRWFTDGKLDLYVWQEPDGTVLRFQFGYNKPDELIINWTRRNGLSHHKVQTGEAGPYNMDASPVLGDDAEQTLDHARNLFVRHANKLEHGLYEFILNKISNS